MWKDTCNRKVVVTFGFTSKPLVAGKLTKGTSMRRERHKGTVKFFNANKGYGFIKPDNGGKDVFVHVTSVQRAGLLYLEDGMHMSYEVEPDANGRGPQAVELQLL